MTVLDTLSTPAAVVDEARMLRNIARMQSRLTTHSVNFRPHVKTSKCVKVVKRQREAGADAITVSTLKEAEAIVAKAKSARQPFAVLIKIDTDGHRSGVKPEDASLIELGSVLHEGGCTIDDVALSVLTTVIGHQQEKGWIICDAGWMAMSRDRGKQRQATDQGYGLICDVAGAPIDGYILSGTNQEHGIISRRDRQTVQDLKRRFPVRSLPRAAQPCLRNRGAIHGVPRRYCWRAPRSLSDLAPTNS